MAQMELSRMAQARKEKLHEREKKHCTNRNYSRIDFAAQAVMVELELSRIMRKGNKGDGNKKAHGE